MIASTLSDEDALNQLHPDNGYDDHDRDQYRAYRYWLDLSPDQALRHFLQERAQDARKTESEE